MVSCIYVSSQVPFFATKLLDVQIVIEADPAAHTWQQVLEISLNHYLAMDTFWTPAGNSLSTQKDLKAEIISLKQSVNSLKLKAKDGQKDRAKVGSKGKVKKDKICFDCGEKNQIKGHEGCKHKGEKLFLPERFKKKTSKSPSNPSVSSAQTHNATLDDESQWPENDEKVMKGKEYVLCRKCFNKFKKKYGRWYAKDHPNAHKTADHKVKNPDQSPQNMMQVNPSTVVTQLTPQPSKSMDLDLSQIFSMTGLTKDELLQKITGTPEMTSRSEVDSSQQRESHLDLNLGLMDA